MDRRQALQRLALLTGGALSFSTVSAVLSGCGPGTDEEFVPAALVDDDLYEFVATVADLIIPETDTPGARSAGVPQFIDKTVAEWMVRQEREHFLNQVEAFRQGVEEEFGESFTALGESEQIRVLEEAQGHAYDREAESTRVELITAWRDGDDPEFELIPGTGQRSEIEVELRPWFRTMKELTVVGYYTSEVGAMQELQYEHTPGRYVPCAPYEDIGRAWA